MPNNPSYIGHRERIREKFAAAGLDSFLDHEALELLLTYAVPRKDTKPIAWALLKKFGSLAAVLDAAPDQLSQIDGVGPGTAQFLKLIRAVFKKYSLAEVKQRDHTHPATGVGILQRFALRKTGRVFRSDLSFCA